MISNIKQFILDNYCFGNDPGLTNESSFLALGIIDSTGILELVAFLETEYGITVEDEELVPDNLDSINNVMVYLKGKLASKSHETNNAEER